MREKQSTTPQSPVARSGGRLPVNASAGGAVLAPPLSNKERAGQLFGEEVGRLPGVLRVERWSEEGSGALTFQVYLQPDDRDTEYAVYELKGRVYDLYPDAYLDVVVLDTISGPLSDGGSGA
jgi:hypothetical protein